MMGSSTMLDQVVYVLSLFLYVNVRFEQVDCSSFTSYSHNSSTLLCYPKHSSALLQFKHTTSLVSCPSPCDHCYPKTKFWKEGTDCCLWDGVTCDKVTGYVIGLDLSSSCLEATIGHNNSLFDISHLQWLNLDFNDFWGSSISSKFGGFPNLKLLNLSSSGFIGAVPSELSYLSKLTVLDLSGDYFSLSQHSFEFLAHNLTRLSVLRLSGVDMTLIAPFSLSSLSSSITVLHLSGTNMNGKMWDGVFCLPNLQELVLSDNYDLMGYLPKSNWSSPLRILDLSSSRFTGSIPVSIGNLTHLIELDFSCNSFSGSIPESIGKLNHLTRLYLVSNHFKGSIPESIGNLTHLTQLDFKFNSLTGQIPDVFGNLSQLINISLSYNNLSGKLPLSLFNLNQVTDISCSYNGLTGPFPYQVGGLSNLISLDLSYNFIKGRVPSWLFTLPSLSHLKLTNNQLVGHIDQFNVFPNSLNYVYLGNNKLTGSFPSSIFQLEHLIILNLSCNNLSGSFPFDMLHKLENLSRLDLSYNSLLSLSSNSTIKPYVLPNLQLLSFSSCNVTKFPSFLRILKSLVWLDLSNNNIHGSIFKTMSEGWENLSSLDLSNNFLAYIEEYPGKKIETIDLRNNLLQGSLLIPPPSTISFLVSHNQLTGRLPPSICNLSVLYSLDLSNNNLNGKIPQCLGNISLEMLHLQMNNFHGRVPNTFAGSQLLSLDLSGNKLEGPLPRSLANCSELEVINIGNNKVIDTFPCWLGALPQLQVLVLRDNELYGCICVSETTFSFSKLRILDLSCNKLNGSLPRRLLENMKAMANVDEDQSKVHYMGGDFYQDSIILTLKRQVIEMERILNIFTAIDLSNNQFEGGIPKALGSFKSLLQLNLSHNRLSGNIPLSLGNLTALESLDLSSNELDGNIPELLKSLTFLEILNLSYNQLSGPIPQGGQFYTFQSDSFIGNLGLCGEPLPEKCSNGKARQTSVSDEEDNVAFEFDWKIVMMGYACGMVIGWSTGYIVFSTGMRQCFIRMFGSEQKRNVKGPGPRRMR